MINNALFLAMIDGEVDKLAFEQLVHNYERRLFRVAMAILKNKTAAEDAVCETFFRVAKCFQKVNSLNVHEIDAYMIISIRSVCFQMYNKEKNSRFN